MSHPLDSEKIVQEDIVNIGGIADTLGVSPSTVSNWIRRHEDFPKSLYTPRVLGIRLYKWGEVRAWHQARDLQPRVIKTTGAKRQ